MIVAIIQEHGKDDFELDQVELPEEINDRILLMAEEHCGCSERGSAEAITYAVKERLACDTE